jgi:aspartate/methionine/tyrosine aminotransferase
VEETAASARFSARLSWDLRPNRLAQLLDEKRRAGVPVLDLTESNPTRAGFAYPGDEILAALADARSLRYDPSPAGAAVAREAVATYYSARGSMVSPDRILLTASTSEAYSYLFKLLANPGDEVLVPRPSYPLFDFLAALEAARTVPYSLRYHDGWELDAAALRAAVSDRTRAIVIVNPNNPTGSFLKAEERTALVSLCRERELTLISDEVFSDYTLGSDANRVATLAGESDVLTFCLNGLSKVAGMPQMKAGWIVLAGPEAAQAAARERLELIADTYLSVATPTQHALPRLLALGEGVRGQIQARVRQNLAWLQSAVASESGCRVLQAEGGWYAILRVPRTRSEEQWCLDLLERDHVLVQPGFFYDFDSEAYLVVSLLPSGNIFREGIGRLLQAVGRTE